MIRNLLSMGVALTAIHHARAQEAAPTTTLMSTTLATSITTAPSSITPIDTARWVSGQQQAASSRASVSSLLGPFYEDVFFIPGATRGDWISAISPAADGGATTVWEVYAGEYYTDPTSRYAYMNVTWAPTTYIETASWPTITLTDAQFEYDHTTMLPIEITTRCSHTSIAPKISVPDGEWQAGLWNPETMNSDHFFTYSASCSYEGHSSLRSGGVSDIVTSHTMPGESGSGWNLVTVVGEKPAAKTGTSSGAAAQTGSGSGTDGFQATSTQAAGASEVTAWINAVVVVAAAAAAIAI